MRVILNREMVEFLLIYVGPSGYVTGSLSCEHQHTPKVSWRIHRQLEIVLSGTLHGLFKGRWPRQTSFANWQLISLPPKIQLWSTVLMFFSFLLTTVFFQSCFYVCSLTTIQQATSFTYKWIVCMQIINYMSLSHSLIWKRHHGFIIILYAVP